MTCAISYTAKKGFVVPDNCLVMALCDDTVETVTGAEILGNTGTYTVTNGYVSGGSGALSIASGKMRITNGAAADAYITDANSGGVNNTTALAALVSGRRYALTLTWTAGTSTSSAGSIVVDGVSIYESWSSTGTKTIYFTAGAAQYLTLYTGSSVSGEYSDWQVISCRIADADASGNGKDLAHYGSITKAAAATNSTTVAYSGFSASNYLYQPYNSDLDFGTADFQFTVWFKLTAAQSLVDHNFIFSRGYYSGGTWVGSNIDCYVVGNTGRVNFRVSDDFISGVDSAQSATSYADGNWHQVHGQRVADTIYLYIDGALVAQTAETANSSGSLNNSSAPLRVGVYEAANSYGWLGSLDGFRIGTGSLTAAEIKEIYDKEKSMFRYGGVYAIDGQSSTIDMDGVAALDRRAPENVGAVNIAEDNSAWGVTDCTDAGWSVTTDEFTEADRGTWEHFFESVKAGESFTFDAFGTIASPVDARTYRMMSRGKIQRINSVDKFRASFELSEIDA